MPKYQLAHDLSTDERATRQAAIDETRRRIAYDASFAAGTQLRGIERDSKASEMQDLGYVLAQISHHGRVATNRDRAKDERISELHRSGDARAIDADAILIRSITTREAHEDQLFALPPSEISLENIYCLLGATSDNPCIIEAGEDLAPLSVHDYEKLFAPDNRFLPPPKHTGRLLFDDAAFARSALEGPNPLLIEAVTLQRLDDLAAAGFDVRSIGSSTLFQGASPFRGEDLDDLARQGRLFCEDYAALQGVRGQRGEAAERIGEGKEQRYTFAPCVLYGLASVRGQQTLLPIAIQPRSNERREPGGGPIFFPNTPGAATYESDRAAAGADYTWQIAKALVLSANTLHHEAVAHLGGTHLLMEAFALAGLRRLSANHPIFGLLAPHMFGTFFINNRARSSLIGEGGDVATYLSCELADFVRVAADSIKQLALDEAYLPRALLRRGVHPTQSKRPLPSYRYAEDALLLWDAVGDFVRDFLSGYYPTHADLLRDLEGELGAFLSELMEDQFVDQQRVHGLNLASIETREDLYELVTMVLFTCSCQHAAVNSGQADALGNPAWSPTAVYRDSPTAFGATRRDYLETLPPFEKAVGQVFIGYQLGGLVFRPLPDLRALQYASFGDSDYGHILAALRSFRDRLDWIERIINGRNAQLPAHQQYRYLLPSRISQSINV